MISEGAFRAWCWCPSQLLDQEGRRRWLIHDRDDDTLAAVIAALETGDSNRKALVDSTFRNGVRVESYRSERGKEDFWAACSGDEEDVLLTFRVATRSHPIDPQTGERCATTTFFRVRDRTPFGPEEAQVEECLRCLLLDAAAELLDRDERIIVESSFPDDTAVRTVYPCPGGSLAAGNLVANIRSVLRDETPPEIRSLRCPKCAWKMCPNRVDPNAKIVAPRGIPELRIW